MYFFQDRRIFLNTIRHPNDATEKKEKNVRAYKIKKNVCSPNKQLVATHVFENSFVLGCRFHTCQIMRNVTNSTYRAHVLSPYRSYFPPPPLLIFSNHDWIYIHTIYIYIYIHICESMRDKKERSFNGKVRIRNDSWFLFSIGSKYSWSVNYCCKKIKYIS